MDYTAGKGTTTSAQNVYNPLACPLFKIVIINN